MDAGAIGTLAGITIGYVAPLLLEIGSRWAKPVSPTTVLSIPPFVPSTAESLTAQTNPDVVMLAPDAKSPTDGPSNPPAANTNTTTTTVNLHYTSPGDKYDMSGRSGFFDGVRTMVRPVLTISFVALFTYVTVSVLRHALYVQNVPVGVAMTVAWPDSSQELLSSVVSFWFGSRHVARMRKK